MKIRLVSKTLPLVTQSTALALFFLLVVFSNVQRNAYAQDIELDRILAVVNEGVVLDSDLRAAIEFFKLQNTANPQSLPPENVIAERLLDQLIDREVLRQHAQNIGVSVDPGSINRALEQIASNNNMDTLRFRETLRQQGFDFDMFRANVEQELLLQRLIERDVQSRIRVSQQEIDDYVEAARNSSADTQRYRISHILVALPAGASSEQVAAANTRAQTILTTLRSGADFAQVAASESDGARALEGGDLGWRNLQELPEFLATAMRDLNVGDLAGPLRSDNGFHVVQLAELQSNDQTSRRETLARHIYMSGDDTQVQRTLSEARAEILNGRPFGEVAAELSQDPNSANNDGELPWFSEGQMPPQMEQAARALSQNEISQPFRTQFGWHILQLLDRRERAVQEQALREQASNELRQSKLEQETQRWARQLRDESFVDVRS